MSTVDHPQHYGGADNPYEAIKVIEAWELGFHLGNAVKYISRAGKKHEAVEDLKKAAWYLDREITRATGEPLRILAPKASICDGCLSKYQAVMSSPANRELLVLDHAECAAAFMYRLNR